MKTERKALLLAFIAGLCFWVLDATLSLFFLPGESFLDTLIFNVSHYHLIIRLLAVLVAVTFALIGSRHAAQRRRSEQALRDSESKFARTFHASPNLMAITTLKEGRIIDVNEAGCRFSGYNREELIGHSTTQLNIWPDPEQRRMIIRILGRAGRVCDLEVEIRAKSGRIRTIIYSAEIVTISNKDYLLSVATDITDRKKAEEQISRQSATLQAINDVFQKALTCQTEEELGKTCLTVAEKLTGSKFGFIGKLNEAGLFDTIAISNPGWDACRMPGSDVTRTTKNMKIRGIDRSILREGQSRIVNNPASHPDHVSTPPGHPPITCFLGVPLNQAGKSIGLIGLGNKEGGYTPADQEAVEALSVAIVEALRYKRAEQRLQNDQRQLRGLASELALSEERQRRRIATGLHDVIGQDLALLKMRLEEVKRSTCSAELGTTLTEILQTLERTIQSTRSLLFDLSPPVLYELGLEPAVEWLTEKTQIDHGIKTVFEDDCQSKPLEHDVRIGLFQSVRELLVNITKHAQAKNIRVSTRRVGPNIEVQVRDDGLGFDVTQVQARRDLRAGGFGLFKIRERLDYFGGTFQIDSEPGRGTHATLLAPLELETTALQGE
ncbi:MAG: PAS domain S-box protein [Actinobacteria bacterium]|nr:PAS domain S-box protein [Actinomycetota bacterium]